MGDDAKRAEIRDRAMKLLTADHFAALGVSRTATTDEVTRAFTQAAKTWHPDRVPASMQDLAPVFSQVFARLDDARRTLTDASARLEYAAKLARPRESSPQLAPADAAMERKKAEVLFKKNDLAGAEQHLRRAVQLAPASSEYQAMLVWVLASKPDCTRARVAELVADLSRIIARDDTCANAYFFRGQLRKRIDQAKEAASDFARAAELDPKNVDAAREVRLTEMRAKPKEEEPSGIGGFFKRLVKK